MIAALIGVLGRAGLGVYSTADFRGHSSSDPCSWSFSSAVFTYGSDETCLSAPQRDLSFSYSNPEYVKGSMWQS